MKTLAIVSALLAAVLLTVTAMAGELPTSFVHISPVSKVEVVTQAFNSLPPVLKNALLDGKIEVTFRNGDPFGAAAGSDHFGLSLETHGVYVRWPSDNEAVSFPWGEITVLHATRHELAHIALERLFQKNSSLWVPLVKALRTESDEFFAQVAKGHQNAGSLRSSSAISHYDSLHEYLASLAEHCGRPVRMPLPTGPARPMVEALVVGGSC